MNPRSRSAVRDAPTVGMVTYSTKARGGVVHCLAVAEALHQIGYPIHVYALGDPDTGFFRAVSVPHTIFPAPEPADTLEQKVWDSTLALQNGLLDADRLPDILHAQDCIAARATVTVSRLGNLPVRVVRTVHHVDDFTSAVLVDCQRHSILDPDHLLVISRYWQDQLQHDFGVDAAVVINGVDAQRFRRPAGFDPKPLRDRIGAGGRTLFLTVGGIEPRKGTFELIEAFARTRTELPGGALLALIGGWSFQDHRAYADRVLKRAEQLGLEPGRDLLLAGTVDDEELPCWYQSADVFVFPSLKEGWGLALLEAMAAGLPAVITDIPVFKEFVSAADALMVPAGDVSALAEAMVGAATNGSLRARLAAAGPVVAARTSWASCARQHADYYRNLPNRQHSSRRVG